MTAGLVSPGSSSGGSLPPNPETAHGDNQRFRSGRVAVRRRCERGPDELALLQAGFAQFVRAHENDSAAVVV
jgi:hypothetical protein